MFLRKNKC